MAPMSLLFLVFLHFSTQTIIGSSSSSSPLDLPHDSLPPPTKDTVRFWPSLPPRGRSDVPIKVRIQDRLATTNAVVQGQRMTHPTTQSNPAFILGLSTQNLSRGGIVTQPTASRPRTDTSSLAFLRALTRVAATKGSTPPLPTLPSTVVDEPADDMPATAGNPEEGSDNVTEDRDLQGLGSGRTPTALLIQEESPGPLPTISDEMAQYRPQAQTMMSKIKDTEPTPLEDQTVKPHLFVLTTNSTTSTTLQPETRATLSPVVTQKSPQTEELTGKKS